MGETVATLGETTFDVYLNARTFWRNVPVSVWRYKLGGYQVLKKWLSYRERSILNRPLKPEEIQHFADTGRRISTDGAYPRLKTLPVVSKNTNELKTRAPGRFGLEVSRLGWPMEAEILGHENADPAFDMVGDRHRWLGPA